MVMCLVVGSQGLADLVDLRGHGQVQELVADLDLETSENLGVLPGLEAEGLASLEKAALDLGLNGLELVISERIRRNDSGGNDSTLSIHNLAEGSDNLVELGETAVLGEEGEKAASGGAHSLANLVKIGLLLRALDDGVAQVRLELGDLVHQGLDIVDVLLHGIQGVRLDRRSVERGSITSV